MGWLRLVGSLKTLVPFAKKPYKRDYILQKRPIFLRSLLIIATPYLAVPLAPPSCSLDFTDRISHTAPERPSHYIRIGNMSYDLSVTNYNSRTMSHELRVYLSCTRIGRWMRHTLVYASRNMSQDLSVTNFESRTINHELWVMNYVCTYLVSGFVAGCVIPRVEWRGLTAFARRNKACAFRKII